MRRIELLAALSLAIDLGLGQPMEHMLRSVLIGTRLADTIGLDAPARRRVVYTILLAWIGCHADSFELAHLFGDDIGFRRAYDEIDARGAALGLLLWEWTGTGLDRGERARARAGFLVHGRATMVATIASHCASAGELAGRLHLDADLAPVLSCTFERWDGRGLPEGRRGTQIPIEMRIAHTADAAEIALRAGETPALDMLRARAGTQLDPELVAAIVASPTVLAAAEGADAWERVQDESGDDATLYGERLDEVLTAFGDFADLKSPYTAGHSRAVADLLDRTELIDTVDPAADAGERTVLRRAGWVHDLGRLGVSNSIWDKATPLDEAEREHLQAHPYLGERIIRRIPDLRREAQLAGSHHERLDGSGYPHGLRGTDLDGAQRLLAVAENYRSAQEPRPYRDACTPDEAADRIRAKVAAGRLDAAAAEAILAAAGDPRPVPRELPAGLTPREAQVLALICQGLGDREIAAQLVIAPKTARNHVEHIYQKISAGNRVGATLFAMEHGLIPPRRR